MIETSGEGFARAEHLQWCKERAIEYTYIDDLHGAIASMISDLSKHPETNNQPMIKESTLLLYALPLTVNRVIRWIYAFN